MVKRKSQIFKKLLLVALGLYIMIGTSLYLLQEKLLFHPTVLAQDYKYSFKYPFEELFLKTDDDAVINALHFKAEASKGVILYFHGNAGDLSRWGIITEYFVAKGYDVLVMDYRTYGKSIGKLSETAMYNDAQMCYDYLKKSYTEENITIYGRSLGTGITTKLAAENNPKQIVLETPYYSIVDVAKSRFPIVPVKYLMHYKFLSHNYFNKVNCPVTIFHGTDDLVVPYESAQKLFVTKNPEQNISFITIENGGHNNLIDFEAYHQRIDQIFP